ncbi:MAG: LL-diaminopimelate aminotransferase [Bacteroidales bacterium]|nr:LL-diaminopimelate aminotransferase [Bacteroidales bacterium]
MSLLNENFLMLQANYLFSDIAKKVEAFRNANPDAKLIRLGIGDVTQPLPQACLDAMHKAVDEQACSATFRGYGPEQGYDFLRKAIVDNDYTPRGVQLDMDEVFVSDGAKSDCGNIGDILSKDCTIGVTDPVYPVYIDSNVMSGRRIVLLNASPANGFVPAVPSEKIDIVYLCYPNNPTGMTLTKEQLAAWVDYARRNKTVIIYDAAYEAYISDPEIPHTIYEIEGAKEVAIEIRSFSKTAGFTGVRCGYTVVPKALKLAADDGSMVELNHLWNRRQCTKFNGTSYITQRAAEAVYSPEGKKQVRAVIDYYMRNASYIREKLQGLGYTVFGGVNAPYIWVKTPEGLGSWDFFNRLLNEIHVVTTPGAGFGNAGEGFIRITAFGLYEDCVEAMKRFETLK